MTRFIQSHTKLYPGLLTELTTDRSASVGTRWYLEMNELIQPKNLTIDSAAFQGMDENIFDLSRQEIIFQRVETLTVLDTYSKRSDGYANQDISNFKKLPLGEPHNIGIFLKHCRKIKELFLHIESPVTVLWDQAFVTDGNGNGGGSGAHFNRLEGKEGGSVKTSGLYSLLNIKTIHFMYTSVAGLCAALDQLRNSVERIEFVGVRHSDPVISWDWTMVKLKYLKLQSVRIDFDSLKYCTELKELVLRSVQASEEARIENRFWTPPKNLRSLSIAYGHAWTMLDQASLTDLKSLRQLTVMDKRSLKVESMMNKVDMSQWPTMDQLQDLSISAGPFQAFGLKRLLRWMPNLRRLGLSQSKLDDGQFDFGMVDTDGMDGEKDPSNRNIDVHSNREKHFLSALAPSPSLRDLAKVSKIEILDVRSCVAESDVICRFLSALGEVTNADDDVEAAYDIFPNLRILGLSWSEIDETRIGPLLKAVMERPGMSYVHFHYYMSGRFMSQWFTPTYPLDPGGSQPSQLKWFPTLEMTVQGYDDYMSRIGKGANNFWREKRPFVRTSKYDHCVFASSTSDGVQFKLKEGLV